jgi:hypothetical protein
VCFAWVRTGKCSRGRSCGFEHTSKATPEEVKLANAGRTRSPSPGVQQGICNQFLAGKCSYGARCKFRHEAASAAASRKKDKKDRKGKRGRSRSSSPSGRSTSSSSS